MKQLVESGSTRQRLVDAASELFLKDGVHATGVAAVAERAGVSKMSLYAYFASKDDLTVAYLDQRDAAWTEAVRASMATLSDPVDKLIDLFDMYRAWLLKGGLRGCAYVNCAAEFPDRSHPVRLAVARHKQGVRSHLLQLAEAAGLQQPDLLAERLFLLLEGAFLTGSLEDNDRIFVVARQLALELVAASQASTAAVRP